MKKAVSLIDFLVLLPSQYTVELGYYWHGEDIEINGDGEPVEGLDEEVSQSCTIDNLLVSDFNGYGAYWNHIDDVFGVNTPCNDGYFSKITIDHINKSVDMIYVRFNYDD